jgi:hypothetical protein
MGPDLSKLSDDELFKRLGLIQSRLSWATSSSHSANLVPQLQYMMEEVSQVINDRVERINFEQNVLSKPAVVNIDGPKEKKQIEETNTRAKSKSDIITRLKRTSVPTSVKDA